MVDAHLVTGSPRPPSALESVQRVGHTVGIQLAVGTFEHHKSCRLPVTGPLGIYQLLSAQHHDRRERCLRVWPVLRLGVLGSVMAGTIFELCGALPGLWAGPSQQWRHGWVGYSPESCSLCEEGAEAATSPFSLS